MRKLFKKSAKTKISDNNQAENAAMSTMPSYMLQISGTNVGTIKKVSEEHRGEKSTLSFGFASNQFLEEINEINAGTSDFGNINRGKF